MNVGYKLKEVRLTGIQQPGLGQEAVSSVSAEPTPLIQALNRHFAVGTCLLVFAGQA